MREKDVATQHSVCIFHRENYLIRPPLEGNGAYWNMNIDNETSMGQAQIVYDIYRNEVSFLHQGILRIKVHLLILPAH